MRIQPDKFLLKLLLTVDFKTNSSGRTRIYKYLAPPPPPPPPNYRSNYGPGYDIEQLIHKSQGMLAISCGFAEISRRRGQLPLQFIFILHDISYFN